VAELAVRGAKAQEKTALIAAPKKSGSPSSSARSTGSGRSVGGPGYRPVAIDVAETRSRAREDELATGRQAARTTTVARLHRPGAERDTFPDHCRASVW